MTAAELAYKTSATDAADGDDLVMQELSQVYYIAARIRERLPQHVEMEDLVSAGVIGLMEASAQLRQLEECAVQDLRQVPHSRRDSRQPARNRLGLALHAQKRPRDCRCDGAARRQAGAPSRLKPRLPQEMQIDPEHLRKIVAQTRFACISRASRSRSRTIARRSLDVIESAPNLDDPDPFDLCLEGEMKSHLAEAISKLSEREQLILSLYYREELTMKEIAKVVGVALSRVSQIRQETMVKLKASLEHLQNRPTATRWRQEDTLNIA